MGVGASTPKTPSKSDKERLDEHVKLVPTGMAQVKAIKNKNPSTPLSAIGNVAAELLDTDDPGALVDDLVKHNNVSRLELEEQMSLEKQRREKEKVGVLDGSNDGMVPFDGAVFVNFSGGKFKLVAGSTPKFMTVANTVGSHCLLAEEAGKVVLRPYGSMQAEDDVEAELTMDWFKRMIGQAFVSNVQGYIQVHNDWVRGLDSTELTIHGSKHTTPQKRKRSGAPPVSDWMILTRIANREPVDNDRRNRVLGMVATYEGAFPGAGVDSATSFFEAQGPQARSPVVWREFLYVLQEKNSAVLTADQCDFLRTKCHPRKGLMQDAFDHPGWLGR